MRSDIAPLTVHLVAVVEQHALEVAHGDVAAHDQAFHLIEHHFRARAQDAQGDALGCRSPVQGCTEELNRALSRSGPKKVFTNSLSAASVPGGA